MPDSARAPLVTKGVNYFRGLVISLGFLSSSGQNATHLEVFQIRHNIGAHQTIVDFVTTPFGVCSHTLGPCALVEALFHVLGRQRELAVSPAEGLCWFEHGGVGGVWPGMAVIGWRVQRKEVKKVRKVVEFLVNRMLYAQACREAQQRFNFDFPGGISASFACRKELSSTGEHPRSFPTRAHLNVPIL